MLRKDSKHLNLKLLYAVSLIATVFVINLLRGSGKKPSIVGNTRCSGSDWFLFSLLFVVGILGTIMSAVWVDRDYKRKQMVGYDFIESEMQMTHITIAKLGILGFFSGFL